MAVRVGIENGTKKGFTKSEIELTNSFGMGVLGMMTGVGKIDGQKGSSYHTYISVEEAHDRFTLALEGLSIFDKQEPVKEIVTLDFVQRMADADWSVNVVNEPTEQFLHKMSGQLMNSFLYKAPNKTLGRHYHQKSWDDLYSIKNSVRSLIGTILQPDEESEYYIHEMIDSLVNHFDFWEDEEFWDGKCLVYDEGADRYTLATKQTEEE